MRRLTRRGERGAAAIAVVIAAPFLVLAGAFVFDGGRGLLARSETQSAADAGALAKATDCALNRSTTVFTAYATNGTQLANSPTCGTGTTTVSMLKTLDLVMAPGGGSRTVTRSATARWGTIGSATVAPIVISSCEFSTALLDGTTDIFLYLDDAKPQSGCSSLPGGFGQLKDDDCSILLSGGATPLADGQPGASLQKVIPCITNATPPALPREVLIAMYDSAACGTGCKGSGTYPIAGFAMFKFTGYRLNGNNVAGTGMPNKCPDEKRSKYCIRGDFVRWVTTVGTPGSSTNFGLLQVSLTS